MALGLIADDVFEAELAALHKPVNKVNITLLERGRGLGTTNIPNAVRELAAQSVLEGARAKDVAEALGVSPSSISAYKNGATSTSSYNTPNAKLNSKIEIIKERIARKSGNVLKRALDAIDDDKLGAASAGELSSVVKNMAATIEKMEGKHADKDDVVSRVQINILTVPQKSIDQFEVIEVNSK